MAKTRSKDNTAINIDAITKEINKLKVSRNNPKRLEELQKMLDWLYYGIR